MPSTSTSILSEGRSSEVRSLILKVDVKDIFGVDVADCGDVEKWFMRVFELIESLFLVLFLLLLMIWIVWMCLMRGGFRAIWGQWDTKIDDVGNGLYARYLVKVAAAIAGTEVYNRGRVNWITLRRMMKLEGGDEERRMLWNNTS